MVKTGSTWSTLDLVFPVQHDAVHEAHRVAPRQDRRQREGDEDHVDFFGVMVVEVKVPLRVELLVLLVVLLLRFSQVQRAAPVVAPAQRPAQSHQHHDEGVHDDLEHQREQQAVADVPEPRRRQVVVVADLLCAELELEIDYDRQQAGRQVLEHEPFEDPGLAHVVPVRVRLKLGQFW